MEEAARCKGLLYSSEKTVCRGKEHLNGHHWGPVMGTGSVGLQVSVKGRERRGQVFTG